MDGLANRPVRASAAIALIAVPARFYPAFFFTGAAVPTAIVGGPLHRLTKIPGESRRHHPAVPTVMKGRFGLLEIDISMDLVGVKEVSDGQLQACFFFHDLFGDGDCSLTHGVNDYLSFHTLRPVKSGQFPGPAMGESELVIDVDEQGGR